MKRFVKGDQKDTELVTENVDFELHDKNQALQLMGKEIGMFKKRAEVSTGPHTFTIEYIDSDKPDPDDKKNNK